MKPLLAFALLLCWGAGTILAAPQEASPAAQETQPEVVAPAASLPPSTHIAPVGEGFMEPQQVKDWLKRLYLAEFRINDLFTQVRPEIWNMPEGAPNRFNSLSTPRGNKWTRSKHGACSSMRDPTACTSPT
jgi:hypothetical protein